MEKKKVLSGIRATGKLHLGNYFGAVKGMIELQNDPEYETFYMIADVHTITTPYKKDKLNEDRQNVLIDYLAAGLDPKRSTIFYQSDVKEHTELSFYLSSIVTIARMLHLPTYKEKVVQYPKNNTMALLNYPVLMAADILLYKADFVPVGIDQEPHLEITREIARKMNQLYGTDFPEPKRFTADSEYVMSLTGEGKMSKTVQGSYINLTDDLETIKSKVSKIPTDSGKGKLINVPNGVKALLSLFELFEGKEKRNSLEKSYENEGLKYQELKNALSLTIYDALKPIQEKRKKILENPKYISEIRIKGAEKARKVALKTLSEVKQKMGFT
jgi:tryptophanyl-tRNA synthetase